MTIQPFDAVEPHAAFEAWFAEARAQEPDVPDALQIATVRDGMPSIRTVLLKQWGPQGWFFYTNYGSRKARELDAHGWLAGVLHWKSLERQVRVRGAVQRADAATSDAYFRRRGRGSQLGAWASRQSEILADRSTLAQRLADVEARFAGQQVPRPSFWGGFRIEVQAMEFWQGRPDRLHDRVVFERQGDGWTRTRLYP